MEIVREREGKTDIQRLYRSKNGYGASVVRFKGSGILCLATIQWQGEDFVINERIGLKHKGSILDLTWTEVEDILKEIDTLRCPTPDWWEGMV